MSIVAPDGVEFVRPEIKAVEGAHQMIADCIAGSEAVKARKTIYLPSPQPLGDIDAKSRYDAYIGRAVFYNVAGRTLDSLVGRVFTRAPVVDVPAPLQPVVDDTDGQTTSVDQLAQKAVALTVAFGGCGLHVDYPVTEGGATRQQLNTGAIKPTIHLHERKNVTNWRKVRRDGRELLTLVVLRETYTITDDGFKSSEATQYRVLRLVNNIYTVELWRKAEKTSGYSIAIGPLVPTDSNGNVYNEIPFRFVNPRGNGCDVEKSPMYDICDLNIAHYRNSADYEESVFVVGQPTVYASGLTETWVKEVLGGKLQIGARGIIPLPEGGNAGMMQAAPNTMAFEAMQHKERQMLALGAKLVEQKQVQRTATEAGIEEQAESSVLSSVARNVSDGILWALQWCGYFVGVEEGQIKFELNTDFDLVNMSPAERDQLLKEWQAEAISFSELRENLRRVGVATLPDNEAMAAIEQDRMNFAPEADTPDDTPDADNADA